MNVVLKKGYKEDLADENDNRSALESAKNKMNKVTQGQGLLARLQQAHSAVIFDPAHRGAWRALGALKYPNTVPSTPLSTDQVNEDAYRKQRESPEVSTQTLIRLLTVFQS